MLALQLPPAMSAGPESIIVFTRSSQLAKELHMSRIITNLILLSFTLATICSAQQGSAAPSAPLQLIPVTPCRVADTRRMGGPIQGGTSRSFSIPQSNCGIPSTAAAYLLNVTVVPNGRLSY